MVSDLIHEIQKERGLSAGYLGSDGTSFWTEMLRQRRAMDVAWSNYETIVERQSELYPTLTKTVDRLKSELRITRLKVLDRHIEMNASTAHYTELVENLIDLSAAGLSDVPDVEIVNLANAFIHLVRAKENAGLERALGATAFGKDQFEDSLYEEFHSRILLQSNHLYTAADFAHEQDRNEILSLNRAPEHLQLKSLRKTARDYRNGRAMQRVEPETWWDTSTNWVERLANAENRLAMTLKQVADTHRGDANRTMGFSTVAGLIAILLGLGIAQITLQGISRQFETLVDAMRPIVGGESRIDVPYTHHTDEISEIARMVETMRRNNAAR